MAEPARKLDDDLNPANRRSHLRLVKNDEQQEPEAEASAERPNLQVIQGGGETSPPTGNLRAVDNDSEGLGTQEASAATPDHSGAAEDAESAQLSGDSKGPKTWKTTLKGTTAQANKNRKAMMAAGGGIGAVIISVVVFIMSYVPIFKTETVIRYIENRIPQTAMAAAQDRLEMYFIRYLIIKALIAQGVDVEGDRTYTYIGSSIPKTLFVAWEGAGLEKKMLDEGVKLVPERSKGQVFGRDRMDPTRWRLEYTNVIDASTGKPKVVQLDSVEARHFMKAFMENHLHTDSVAKRHIMKVIASKYFGYGLWKPFERTQNKGKEWWRDKKAAFFKGMTRVTLGRIAPVKAAELTCLLDGGDNCKPENLQARGTPGDLDPEASRAVEDAAGNGDSRQAARTLTEALEKMGLKTIITAAASGMIVLKVISAINTAVSVLPWLQYMNNSQVNAGIWFFMNSANDQLRSGEDFDNIDPGITAEALNGFEAAPFYRSTKPDSKVSAAAPEQFTADCDDNGSEETTLAIGETLCEAKKLMRSDGGLQNEPWFGALSPIAAAYDTLIKKPAEWLTAPLQIVMDATGVSGAIQYVLDQSHVVQKGVDLVMMALGDFAGRAPQGAIQGRPLAEAMLIGATAVNTTLGGPVQGTREGTVGGAYLTEKQVAAIYQEDLQYQQYALSQKSTFERYFSPEVDNSLTSYAIMNIPTSVTSLSTSFLSSINPATIFSRFGSLFMAHSSAQAGKGTFNNPAGGIFTGMPHNHPSNTMDVDELRSTYRCDEPEEDRPQNKKMGRPDGVPFDVHLEADPCVREKFVEKLGLGYVTGKYDDTE